MSRATIFASRKLAFVDLLGAIALFVNAAKGLSALQLSRCVDVSYKTVFVLAQKLRQALSFETQDLVLDTTVEIDGAYVGGYPTGSLSCMRPLRDSGHLVRPAVLTDIVKPNLDFRRLYRRTRPPNGCQCRPR